MGDSGISMEEQIGRYEIRRELGQGGMATVYLAYDPRFQRQVAVKVLPRQFTHDPKYLARFEQEARMIASLEHPAIVPVYDFGEEEDAPYLVMRYMPGGSLRDRLQGEPLPLDETLDILGQLAPAVDYAHELGIVHRDLKPENIFFDADGRPYLADFGIARLAEDTKTLTVVGTRAYMSPEQVEGDVTPDGRVDIYALGVILYELLTGKQPYEAETPTKQMMAHVLKPVPKILEDNPDLPPQIQVIIDKVMAKKREERYATAGDLALAFNRLVGATDSAAAEAKVRNAALMDVDLVMEPAPSIVDPVPESGDERAEKAAIAIPAAIDAPDETVPEAAPASDMSRPTTLKLLIALAVIAGILALIDACRYTGLIDFSMLPGFGSIWLPAPQWFVGVVLAGIACMWFVTAYRLRSFNPYALILARLTAIVNLIIMGRAFSDGVSIVDMMWGIVVNILALILSFLPSTKKALSRATPETAGNATTATTSAAINPDGGKSFAEQQMTRSGPPPWWTVTLEGGLLILISLYLIRPPSYDWEEIAPFFGVYWSISGVMNLVKLYFDRSLSGLKIAAGACGIIGAFFLIQYLSTGYIHINQNILLFLGIVIGSANLIQGIRGAGRGTFILGITGISMAVLLLAAQADIIYELTPWLGALLSGIGGALALIASLQMRR